MYGYGYSLYNRLAFLGSLDPDATAFFSATGITDPTIQGAINSLCVDLKTYGVWDKMKAIYPFVGGTATTHKFNLKDPRDLDVAFRLAFNGGWTHSSNGALPNGTNGYANTFFVPSTNLLIGSQHLSVYNRTNNTPSTSDSRDIGTEAPSQSSFMTTRRVDNLFISRINSTNIVASNSNASGYFISTRNVNTLKAFKNNSLLGSAGQAGALPILSLFLATNNILGIPYVNGYSNQQIAFTTIGDGLTDEDSANLYYSIQKFQTTLGRQVGTPIYSSNATDVNARLFLGATNIQDVTITSAVDTLVQGLKTDGIWSKLKAVYPFVGGTATTHKFNLANALDEDTAFRLAFSGGVTHSSNGVVGNGVNGFANTFINPLTNLSQNSVSVNIYSRNSITGQSDFGAPNLSGYLNISNKQHFKINQSTSFSVTTNTQSSLGLFSFNRVNSTQESVYKNGNLLETFSKNSVTPTPTSFTLLALVWAAEYGNKQQAFASIGDGLTPTEITNLNTRVQAFQTTLNRQV